MTNTITMNGNATGYGASSGSESFILNGYVNTVLLAGADDTVTVAGGGQDTIDLNSTGFTNAVSDVIDLGQSAYNSVLASNALYGATLMLENGVGENHVSLVNHGGSTTLVLGNTGDKVNHGGLGLNDIVSLNGDATNSVTFTSGMGAQVSIGSAGDGFSNDVASVAFYGNFNTLSGGDENFAVTDQSGLNQVILGNGANQVTLGGDQNVVVLGGGNNSVAFSGHANQLAAGAGSNEVSSRLSGLVASFAAGGAGSTDTLAIAGSKNHITGGNENFVIAGGGGTAATVHLGDGNDQLTLGSGVVTLGDSVHNTAQNSVVIAHGGARLTFNGGLDQVSLQDSKIGYDRVTLNGTMLGTNLTAAGSFDSITLTADANAALTETAVNGGLSLFIDGDKQGGIGTISITGLAQDDLAHITLVGTSNYTVTTDDTQAGGLTLHFSHGSIDLVGLQAISNTLITGPVHV